MGEENATENIGKKRDRQDSDELDSCHHESKRVHLTSLLQSDVWKPNSPGSSAGEIDGVGSFALNNGIPEDILDSLDDADTMPENQDLDSVIRSFEEEILQSSPSIKQAVIDFKSDSGEYQLDLGYLLEASDYELGLPPTGSSSAEERPNQDPINPLARNASEVADLGDLFTLENELPRYDSFGFELGEVTGVPHSGDGGFADIDGFTEYSEPSDPADLSWLCGCT